MSAVDLWIRQVQSACLDYVYGVSDEQVRLWKKEQRDAAEEWLFSESREPGSFLWVCDNLGVNPMDLRARVKTARNRSTGEPRPEGYGDIEA